MKQIERNLKSARQTQQLEMLNILIDVLSNNVQVIPCKNMLPNERLMKQVYKCSRRLEIPCYHK